MTRTSSNNASTIVDPTKNVLDLVNAAVARLNDLADKEREIAAIRDQRQDDLRLAQRAYMEESFSIRKELRISDAEHLDEMLRMRAEYEDRLREKESQRLDAIRAVDTGAVSRAAEVQAAQATALATQTSALADTLRNQVAATAAASATQLSAAVDPLLTAIAELRRTQYEQQGQKAAQVESRSTRMDDRSSNQWIIATVLGSVFFISNLVLAIVLFVILHH